MKTFRYKWRIGSNELVGSRDAEDESALRIHVEAVGGELLHIMDQVELPPPEEQHTICPNTPAETDLEIERQLNNPSQKKSSQHGTAILLISVLAFFSFGLFQNSFVNVLVLVAVLFIHELGHLIAMRAFKYRDPGILFIPLLGAVTSGQEIAGSGSRRAIVSLAGPLPEILIGILLGVAYLRTGQQILIEIAKTFLILNILNLLPIYPLDGGQFMNTVVFSRKRKLELGFQIVMVVILAVLAFLGKDLVIAFLAAVVFFAMFGTSLLSSIAERLRPGIPENQTLSVTPPLPYIEQIREELFRKDGFKRLSSKKLAMNVLEVWKRICRKPLKWQSAVGWVLAYLLTLTLGVVSFVAVEVMSFQHAEASYEASMTFKRFTSEEGNFSILMPGVPEEQSRILSTPRGTLQARIFYDSHKVSPFFYTYFAVMYADIPEDLIQSRTLEERLDASVKGWFLYQKGKLLEQKDIMFSGNSGREVLYKAEAPLFFNMQCVLRIFDVGGRIYNVIYAENRKFSFSNKLNLDAAYKFFDSFELVVSGTES
ncbi:MAG: hypothetical protein PHV97_04585 [Candidatus Omnitrophica bacterium]|nr:hypothetical protein [Candidatus Omnitrophota bacterium]